MTSRSCSQCQCRKHVRKVQTRGSQREYSRRLKRWCQRKAITRSRLTAIEQPRRGQRPKERLNSKAGAASLHISLMERSSRGHCVARETLSKTSGSLVWSGADRPVRLPRGLEYHSRCRLISLHSDPIEYIDRRTIACMANSLTAIIGADQPDAGLIVGSEGNIVGSETPRLIAEADAFTFSTSGAGEQNTSRPGPGGTSPGCGDVSAQPQQNERHRGAWPGSYRRLPAESLRRQGTKNEQLCRLESLGTQDAANLRGRRLKVLQCSARLRAPSGAKALGGWRHRAPVASDRIARELPAVTRQRRLPAIRIP